MNKLIKWGVLAAFAGSAGTVYADTAETKGGLKVKTDDGRFEMTLGGRIHLDMNLLDNDTSSTFASGGSKGLNSNSTVFFRRARLAFAGKAYGWEYLFVPDFAQSTGGNLPAVSAGTVNTGDGNAVCEATPCTITVASQTTSTIAFQELYIAHGLFGGKIFLGQFKPFRGIEELTSSNEITFMERPWTTATGIYNRQFQIGAGWQTNFTDNLMFSTSIYNLRRDNSGATEGVGSATRVTFAPLMKEGMVLHLGASYSLDNPHGGNLSFAVPYSGRRGPSLTLNSTADHKEAQFIGGEVAGVFGPFYFQGEYVNGDFESNTTSTSATAYHFQASFNVTGEVKAYDNKKAVFKNIKPKASWGAVELKARYDFAENDDATLAAGKEATAITVGANYYVNPNVRFMLDYVMGEAELANGQKDEPNVLAARAQMNW